MDTGSAETLVPPSPSSAVLMAPGGSADWSLMAPFDRGVAGWGGRVRTLGLCDASALLRVLCIRILWANTFQILLLLSLPNSCDIYPEFTVYGVHGEY